MPTTTTQREGPGSRRRILDATIALACERGFAGTSIRSICEKVGLAKTAIYWHFGSKEGLIGAVIEDVTATWIDEIERAVAHGGTPEERLDRLVESLQHLVEHRPDLFRIVLVPIIESATVAPEVRDTMRRLTDRAIDAIVRGYREVLGFDMPDMDLVGHTIIGMTHAALRRKLMDPDADLDRLFADLRRTMDMLTRDRMKQVMAARENRKKS